MSDENSDSIANSPADSRPLLEAVQKMLGSVPNLFRIVGNSPAALEGYLGLNGALGKGHVDAPTRARIALAVAAQNGCDYCLSAHTFMGKMAKLDDGEMAANRDGRSADKKAAAAVRFAIQVVSHRGHVTAADVAAVKAAGFDDGQIVEIIAHVAINTLTNYLNTALATTVDFPQAAPQAAYGASCAVAVSMGKRVASDASSQSHHHGRLFRFSSAAAKATFDADPDAFVSKPEAHWPQLSA